MRVVYAAAAWTKGVVRSGEAWGRRESGWVGRRCNAAGKSTRATGLVLDSNARETGNAMAEEVLGCEEREMLI